MLHIELFVANLYLPGSNSLKEKRMRTRGIRDKWGKLPHLSVVESDDQAQWQRSEWSFLMMSTDRKLIDQTFAKLEQDLTSQWDFVLTTVKREML